jgi:hypothetical protein
MKDKLVIIFLVLVTIFLGAIPVSANTWDDLKQLEKLSTIPKISDMNSVPVTSSSFNDPFGTSFIQPVSSFNTPTINPFNTIVPATNYIGKIPSTSLYDSYLNDQMRQMKYTTDISTTNSLISTYGNKVETDAFDNIRSQFYPSPQEEQQRELENNVITYFETRLDWTPGTIAIPYNSLKTMNSLYQNTYDRMGVTTQILSMPKIDPVKYTAINYGPYGMFGGQTVATDNIVDDHFSISRYDEYNSAGLTSINHFYTEKATFNDIALPYTPGVSVSGTRIETDTFHTPLSGIGGLQMSHLQTNYPSFGYDPSTDWGTRSITQNMQYTIQSNPGISNINRINSIPSIPSYTRYQSF